MNVAYQELHGVVEMLKKENVPADVVQQVENKIKSVISKMEAESENGTTTLFEWLSQREEIFENAKIAARKGANELRQFVRMFMDDLFVNDAELYRSLMEDLTCVEWRKLQEMLLEE